MIIGSCILHDIFEKASIRILREDKVLSKEALSKRRFITAHSSLINSAVSFKLFSNITCCFFYIIYDSIMSSQDHQTNKKFSGMHLFIRCFDIITKIMSVEILFVFLQHQILLLIFPSQFHYCRNSYNCSLKFVKTAQAFFQ